MQLSPHSLSESHGDDDTEVPEEINPRQCGEWKQVYHYMRVINECLDGTRQNGNTLTDKHMEEPTTARKKTAAPPGACLPQESQEGGKPGITRQRVLVWEVGEQTVGAVNWKTAWAKLCQLPPTPTTHMHKCFAYPPVELEEHQQPRVHPQAKPGTLSAADVTRAPRERARASEVEGGVPKQICLDLTF